MKKLSIIATLLLLIGIVGVLFTFNSENDQSKVLEEKVIDTNDFQHINIESNNGNITILPTNENTATVTLIGNDHSAQLITNVDEDTLQIKTNTKETKLFSFGFPSKKASVEIYLPEKEYKQIYATSKNGKITMQDIVASDVQLETNNGKHQVDKLQSETVSLRSNNGKIEANDIKANTVEVDIDNGKASLKQIEADVIATSSNGKISLETAYLNHSTDLQTDNGKIEIKTENKPDNVTFDLRTQNGKITVFGENNWDTKVGDGKHLIKLAAENGSISITNK